MFTMSLDVSTRETHVTRWPSYIPNCITCSSDAVYSVDHVTFTIWCPEIPRVSSSTSLLSFSCFDAWTSLGVPRRQPHRRSGL